MNKLACDVDDTVKETFASELDQTLLYFYKVKQNHLFYMCVDILAV